MKKILSLGLVLALGVSSILHADAAVRTGGSDFQTGARVGLGNYPGSFANIACPMTAQVAITVGMAVKASTDTSVWYNTVSPTGSAGDQLVLGIATNTVAAGGTCWVAIKGTVAARYPSGTTITVGVLWTSTAAGALTPTSSVSGTTNTARAISIVIPLETKSVDSGGLVRSIIIP